MIMGIASLAHDALARDVRSHCRVHYMMLKMLALFALLPVWV